MCYVMTSLDYHILCDDNFWRLEIARQSLQAGRPVHGADLAAQGKPTSVG